MKALLACFLLTGCANAPQMPTPVVAATPVEITLPLAELRACIDQRNAEARAKRVQASKKGAWREYADKLESLLGIDE